MADPLIEFAEAEVDVGAFIATVAAENKTGKVTDGRAATLRRDLAALRDELQNPAAFVFGLRAAIGAGAGNVHYAAKAARGFVKRAAAPGGPLFGDRVVPFDRDRRSVPVQDTPTEGWSDAQEAVFAAEGLAGETRRTFHDRVVDAPGALRIRYYRAAGWAPPPEARELARA